MKKIVALFIVALIALTSVFAFDIDSLIGGDNVGKKLTTIEKAEIQRAAREEGMTVSFGKDDSITFTNSETKESIVISSDRSEYKIYDAKGNLVGSIGSSVKMEKNEYTDQIPDPTDYGMKIVLAMMDGGYSFVLDGKLENAKNYISALKKKGFTIDVSEETQDLKMYGLYILSFEADNKAGYHVAFTYTDIAGTVALGLIISK